MTWIMHWLGKIVSLSTIFNETVIPSVLDGGSQIILANHAK